MYYILLTVIFLLSSVKMNAQGSVTIRGGGAVTVNGNLVITNGCGLPITDIRDGKVYNTVMIGNQCWMQQNLNYGTRINGSADQTNNGIYEKYCYNDDENYCSTYGGLYQWDEAMQYSTTEGVQGICPAGWHLPTHGEWTTLKNFLGGSIAGGQMKEAGTNHWHEPNTGATNSSGFTGLPGGDRGFGGFYNLTYNAYFWTSSQYNTSDGWDWNLFNIYEYLSPYADTKAYGFSVRCLKD